MKSDVMRNPIPFYIFCQKCEISHDNKLVFKQNSDNKTKIVII